jgi:hypothetical protein
MKAKPSKPNHKNKAGGELPYKNAESVIGGPICNDPQDGLNADKPSSGEEIKWPVK